MQAFIDLILGVIEGLGYFGIFLGMAIESSFIPFPSEVIMIPAGYLVFQGKMNGFLAVFFGIVGSLTGAVINYYLAHLIGRPFLYKYGKYFLISPAALGKAESFFKEHGEISTFTCRLLPGIRQIISIPAGLVRMKLSHFIFFTSLGSGIWIVVLTVLGYVLGQNEAAIKRNLEIAYMVIFGVLAVLVACYIFWRKYKLKKNGRGV